eukprot:TRINITY_DN7572_c0_g1_i1.p1 TRINITY_DN7572_c0_g1~~TRINITY_DN7572_c0_g1_i1.p1  ORF type:complete len:273 (-),score=48.42 TRINITY_DN7572_c0_g1_i1:69-839(-)
MKIDGNTFIVTGGASGLGEGTVLMLHAGGANVAVFDRDVKRGETLVATLGSRALFCAVDVMKEDTVQAAVEATVQKFGSIQGLINSAGIASAQKTYSKGRMHSQKMFDIVVGINLSGTFSVIKFVVAQMAKQEADNADGEKGVIINTASVAAYEGQQGQVSYSASKGGVVAMTVPLAREVGPLGIRVLTIAPGIMWTPMLNKLPEKVREQLVASVVFPKRLGTPEDYALLVQQLLANRFLNSTTIRLDAGVRMAKL